MSSFNSGWLFDVQKCPMIGGESHLQNCMTPPDTMTLKTPYGETYKRAKISGIQCFVESSFLSWLIVHDSYPEMTGETETCSFCHDTGVLGPADDQYECSCVDGGLS